MPPLPNTFDDEAVKLIASIQRREEDLSEFQIPRLQKCQGPLSVQQSLAIELREDVEAYARQVEVLDELVEDQRGDRNRRELRKNVDEFRRTLASIRKNARIALLTSKRTIDSQSQSHREELLRSSAVKQKQDPNGKVTDDALMKVSDDVTEALRRTIGLMQGELERSVLSQQLLDTSTASLRSTSSTYDTLTNVMGTSKQLITALEKSDWLDRMLLLAGLAFFFLVVLFILKQRIVDRGLRIALWWTRFLPDFTGDAELLNLEKGEAVATAVSSSSTVTAAMSGAASTAATLASVAMTQKEPRTTAQPESEPRSSSAHSSSFLDSLPISSVSLSDPARTSVHGSDVHDEL